MSNAGIDYPLVNVYIAIENGPVEIVDLPMNSMVIFHSFLYVYQAGYSLPHHFQVSNLSIFWVRIKSTMIWVTL
jgi:hypothetical protein